jgi:hypothetical protein
MNSGQPRMTPIIAGQRCVGFLLNTTRGVAAYDANEKSLGVFSYRFHISMTWRCKGMRLWI